MTDTETTIKNAEALLRDIDAALERGRRLRTESGFTLEEGRRWLNSDAVPPEIRAKTEREHLEFLQELEAKKRAYREAAWRERSATPHKAPRTRSLV